MTENKDKKDIIGNALECQVLNYIFTFFVEIKPYVSPK